VVFIKDGMPLPVAGSPLTERSDDLRTTTNRPGYSDSWLSESPVAKLVNTVALSPYWKNSAAVVLWDDFNATRVRRSSNVPRPTSLWRRATRPDTDQWRRFRMQP
jgi:hypothetical protein